MNLARAKTLLIEGAPAFWTELRVLTEQAGGFDDLIFLSSLRKKAVARGLKPAAAGAPLRLAILGGCSLYPLHELLTHLLAVAGVACELFLGDYDNYVAEISEAGGALYQFRSEVILLLPGAQRCKHPGALTDPPDAVRAEAHAFAAQLLDLCRVAHERTQAEVLLGNFALPARRDPGPFRSRALASDWSFRKLVNLELGVRAPAFVRLCDLEFLAHRHGALAAEDARGWFESKQPCSPALLVDLAREAAHLILTLRAPPKKVLVLDLDNTLWGGVVADDGIEGIELGDTSPRGEAFKAFQKYVASLKERGVLLAVCSKNDHARAFEAVEKHPEMVLRPADFVAFTANWDPKSDNLRRMAVELELGLDSFVFVDDNPAEIEIVRQFAPEVTTILLGPDPADYVGQLQDCRLFESHSFTAEDAQRTGQYRAEAGRKALLVSASDMDAYLESLAMTAEIREFTAEDAPRLAQLINKSNQFNLTTRRRTEAEVLALVGRAESVAFSVRLADRFGDHGLISIVIGHVRDGALEIDTWLMSCRVLKRQVEETVLNELARLARARGCARLAGVYLPTAKNEMVRDFYPRMGFAARSVTADRGEFALELDSFQPRPTKISLRRRAYESD
ncbi:MAG: HAD-IIIC family phosphatase [Verrucomicrobia bacterium]|nr:HAD-IIIC family phosphatase [Verrucomicrobiota bacterium]